MISRKIFLQRVWDDWKCQWEVLRSVLDWSVIMYIVVPVLIMTPFIYLEMWEDIHLYWNKEIPFNLLIGVVLLLLLRGNFRTFLYDADILFLLRYPSIINPLKRWGFHYSLLQLIVGTSLLMILILPILCLMYDYKVKEILFLLIIVIAYRLLSLTVKMVTRTLFKWSFLFVLLFLFILFISMVDIEWLVAASIIIILGIYYFHLYYFVTSKRYFFEELSIERAERVRYIKFIHHFSMDIEKTSKRLGHKPILFRNSKKLFQNQTKENGLLELLLKAFLRNNMFISHYFQLIGITIFTILVLPVWIKWIIFFSFIFFIYSWIKSVYNSMLDDLFFKVIPYDKKILLVVWPRFRRWIGLPAFILVGGLTLMLSLLELLN